MRPQPIKSIADSVCGNGGFFFAAYDFLVQNNKVDKGQNKFLKLKRLYGNEGVKANINIFDNKPASPSCNSQQLQLVL